MGKGKKRGVREDAGISIAAMLLVTLRDEEAVYTRLEQEGYKRQKADKLVEAARQRIVLAADVDRRRELGVLIERLRWLYEEAADAVKNADRPADKTAAIRVAKEITVQLGEVLDLQNHLNVGLVEENVKSQVEEFVRGHLEGLRICEEGLPLEELARRVAARSATLLVGAENNKEAKRPAAASARTAPGRKEKG